METAWQSLPNNTMSQVLTPDCLALNVSSINRIEKKEDSGEMRIIFIWNIWANQVQPLIIRLKITCQLAMQLRHMRVAVNQ